MKNHIKVDGKLLQTNKKWSHLKAKQKEWIYSVAEKEYNTFVNEYNKIPLKRNKDIIFDKVYESIVEREIWIPYHEAKMHLNKFIDRMNRKNSPYEPKEKEGDGLNETDES